MAARVHQCASETATFRQLLLIEQLVIESVVGLSAAMHNHCSNSFPQDSLKTANIAAMLVLCCVSACERDPAAVLIQAPAGPLVADGHTVLTMPMYYAGGRRRVDMEGVTVSSLAAPKGHGSVGFQSDPPALLYKVGVVPGTAKVTVNVPKLKPIEVEISTTVNARDSFRDGTPDCLRLDSVPDRHAFRHWFTAIAEAQAFVPKLPQEINDCAALLRYSYRESMSRHTPAWANEAAVARVPPANDITKYLYPYTPVGPRLFRVHEGPFAASDLSDGTFAEFADVKTLVLSNAHLTGRDVHKAEPGDLLFYRQFEQQSSFHSMIFVGTSHFGKGDDWVVYHTGPNGSWPGEIRRVTLASLLNHPDPRWRPVPGNRNFLGVYRWNILRGAK